MDVNIYARNLELNKEAETYIRKKFKRLERHLNQISDAKLEVSRTSARSAAERVVTQMTLTANGYILRGQETGPNLYAAVDAVTHVMDRQIQRYKAKVYRSGQSKKSAKAGSVAPGVGAVGHSPDDTLAEDLPTDDLAGEVGTVVRTKRFPMKPITVEEAVLEMELLGHDFFLFHNVETGEHSVVYHRRDGNYGLIEPEQA